MHELLARIRTRLFSGNYQSEAQVSVSIVLPVLRALGWDDTDPLEVCPEYGSGRGRVDFALMGTNRRPALFVEVKATGRSVEGQGDRQLFEYAFHEGVPLCVLTDGRDWNFYLPGEQGSYDDRRVHRLLIDERPVADCAAILGRYLARERVRSGAAYDDARRDYRDGMRRREAQAALPRAWQSLLAGPDDLLVEQLSDRAEALCGVRPDPAEAAAFLRAQAGEISGAWLRLPPPPEDGAVPRNAGPTSRERPPPPAPTPGAVPDEAPPLVADGHGAPGAGPSAQGRQVRFRLFGVERTAETASEALVEILRALVARDPGRVALLAEAVRGRSRNHVARRAEDVYPARPDLARAESIGEGWLVGLNISNRDKKRILLAACDTWGLRWGEDLAADLPNA
jgi:hypothetical protein